MLADKVEQSILFGFMKADYKVVYFLSKKIGGSFDFCIPVFLIIFIITANSRMCYFVSDFLNFR